MKIPGGTFSMGDHHNFVDPQRPSDAGRTLTPIGTIETCPSNAPAAAFKRRE